MKAKLFRLWGFGFLFFLLAGCTDYISIVKPIEISKPGQKVSINFSVNQFGGYRLAIFFVHSLGRDATLADWDARRMLFGSTSEPGVVVPVHVKVFRDGELFYEGTVLSEGTEWGESFQVGETRKRALVRSVNHFGLEPGEYYLELTTLSDVQELVSIETYIEFGTFDPKI
ncbi:DUF5625 family protein [Pseudomonas sp. LP_7_YM]|uniref:DUF5625 family protein n=1 Tax=Pseudomonas sp. LP_7_YM TaxID=2485137 RepID=UPI00105E83C6|nr:DUF5625 family protein [Pseudomonas sp. LP_7_YM]TDV69944.1 hypothetical protein EC915_102205 [Pseudomonas sp. LP_7_YM]